MSTEQRIIEIESKLAYQEDLLQTLNNVVYRQQEKINQLEAQNSELVERLKSLIDERDNETEAEPPPHY